MNRTKKLIAGVLALGMMIGLAPRQAFAADYVDSATYDTERHDFSWYNNGTLQLSCYYNQVRLDETNTQERAINDGLAQHYNEFYAKVPEKSFRKHSKHRQSSKMIHTGITTNHK